MYGGFTPAGGAFAGLTSMAMTGTYPVLAVVLAFVLAMGVAAAAKKLEQGHAQAH